MDRFITKKPRLQDTTTEAFGSEHQSTSGSSSNCYIVDKPDVTVTQPPIPKYHVNDIGSAVGKILNDYEKYKFLQETWKPKSDYKYPIHKDGKQNRKFRHDWMEQFKWLAYSEKLCGGFCKVCVLFAPSGAGSGSQTLRTFVKEPLQKFKNALSDMKQHEETDYHTFCMEKSVKFQGIMESGGSSSDQNIAVKMDNKMAKIVEENRKRLRPIIKTVIFCARNNLPLRGHRDDGQFNYDEKASDMISGKMGVFRSLLAFRIDAGDEDLKSHLSTCKRNSSMISKTVQNEVIECIGEVLRTSVVSDIERNKFYSILVDETADVSSKEQLTFCVRFIDLKTCTTQEAFLGFVELKSTTSMAIKTAIDEEMLKLNLSYEYLCGQGYDGASNMAGHLNGVHKLISKQQPLAVYTHCFSHSLNLCITKTCEIPIIRNVMGTVASISTFVSASPNRVNLLIDAIDQSNKLESTKKRLKALCPTRWVERHESLMTFNDLLIPVVIMLEDLSSTSTYSDVSSKANMLCCAVKKSEFIIGLEVSVYCLSFTLRLSEQLQSPKQDLSSAVQHVEDVLATFNDIRRNADTEFCSIFQNSLKRAEELGFEIKVPRTCSRQTERSNTPGSNAEEYFKRVVFLPYIDHITSELTTRFTNKDFNDILPLEGLIPSNLGRYDDEIILKAAHKYEVHLEGSASLSSLKSELRLWRRKWEYLNDTPSTCTEALKRLDLSFFPLIGVLLQILGTVPVTTATAERSFSVLRRLKTYLRSTMGESRLNGLALANVLKDREINIEQIINVFCQKKSRRMVIENWECD